MKNKLMFAQRGLSLTGLIFILAILGGLGVLGLRVVPTVSEYMSIKKAVVVAKQTGTNVREIQQSFDKQADANYISSISGKDLEIFRSGEGYEVRFAYPKKISLGGPVSLLIEYEGSTEKKAAAAKSID